MNRHLLAAGALLLPCAAHAVPAGTTLAPTPASIGAAALDAQGRVPSSKSYTQGALSHSIGYTVSLSLGTAVASTQTAGAYQETVRLPFTNKGPYSQLSLFVPSKIISVGLEVNEANAVFHKAAFECAGGLGNTTTHTYPILYNKDPIFVVDPASNGFYTDVLGAVEPPGTSCFIRWFTGVLTPPATASAAVATGGALAASTSYYYFLTTVFRGYESGPIALTSVPTTASALTENLAWTAPLSALGCDSVRIYRGTTAAVASSAFLDTVACPKLSYTDAGAASTVAGIVPPAAQVYHYDDLLQTGWSTTSSYTGVVGNQADMTNGTGALPKIGPIAAYVTAPGAIMANDVAYPTHVGIGDSIQTGTGQQTASVYLGGGSTRANWYMLGMANAGFSNVANLSVAGGRLDTLLSFNSASTLYGGSQRLKQAEDNCAGGWTFSDLVSNDLSGSNAGTWQSIAANQIVFGRSLTSIGCRYAITTMLPRGTSTDNMLTTANYTALNTEPSRILYNTWVRGGMNFSPPAVCTGAISGTAATFSACASGALVQGMVLSGSGVTAGTYLVSGSGLSWTVNASQTVASETINGAATAVTSGGGPVMCGTIPCIGAAFDLAQAMGEVNAAGTPTLNGGYWPPGVLITPPGTVTQAFTGTPTTVTLPVGSASYTPHGLGGQGLVIKITSGAASGQSCIATDNTAVSITCGFAGGTALTTAPAAGDTFAVYATSSLEGTHPTSTQSAVIAAGANGTQGFTGFAGATFVSY